MTAPIWDYDIYIVTFGMFKTREARLRIYDNHVVIDGRSFPHEPIQRFSRFEFPKISIHEETITIHLDGQKDVQFRADRNSLMRPESAKIYQRLNEFLQNNSLRTKLINLDAKRWESFVKTALEGAGNVDYWKNFTDLEHEDYHKVYDCKDFNRKVKTARALFQKGLALYFAGQEKQGIIVLKNSNSLYINLYDIMKPYRQKAELYFRLYFLYMFIHNQEFESYLSVKMYNNREETLQFIIRTGSDKFRKLYNELDFSPSGKAILGKLPPFEDKAVSEFDCLKLGLYLSKQAKLLLLLSDFDLAEKVAYGAVSICHYASKAVLKRFKNRDVEVRKRLAAPIEDRAKRVIDECSVTAGIAANFSEGRYGDEHVIIDGFQDFYDGYVNPPQKKVSRLCFEDELIWAMIKRKVCVELLGFYIDEPFPKVIRKMLT